MLTWLPVANFFSVPTMAPVRAAALSAPLPFMTVSRCEPPPLTLLPILVTVSQSSDILVMDFCSFGVAYVCRTEKMMTVVFKG